VRDLRDPGYGIDNPTDLAELREMRDHRGQMSEAAGRFDSRAQGHSGLWLFDTSIKPDAPDSYLRRHGPPCESEPPIRPKSDRIPDA
jgi:hypothetical protein